MVSFTSSYHAILIGNLVLELSKFSKENNTLCFRVEIVRQIPFISRSTPNILASFVGKISMFFLMEFLNTSQVSGKMNATNKLYDLVTYSLLVKLATKYSVIVND